MKILKKKFRFFIKKFVVSASSEIREVDQNPPETCQGIEPPWEHEWPLTAESPKTPLKEGDRGSWPLEERTPRLEMEVKFNFSVLIFHGGLLYRQTVSQT